MSGTSITTVVGNIRRGPEIKTTGGGTVICKFAVPVNRPKRGGEEQVSDWFNVLCFGKTAEFVDKYFKEGDGVVVTGRIELELWKPRDGGEQRASLNLVANHVSFGPSASKEAAEEPARETAGGQQKRQERGDAKPTGGEPGEDVPW